MCVDTGAKTLAKSTRKSKKVKKKPQKSADFIFPFWETPPPPRPRNSSAEKKKRSVIREMRNPAAYRITMGRDKFFFPTVVLIGFSAYRFSELIGRFIFKDIYFFSSSARVYQVLLGFTEFYWIAMGFNGFYLV